MRVGVVLAAGASSRMGAAKPLKKTRGHSFTAWAVRNLWSVCDTVIVVLGHQAKPTKAALEAEFTALVDRGALAAELKAAAKQGARALELHFVSNPKWKQGMLSSARLGLAEAASLKPESVFVLPVDHPAVQPATVRQLAAVMKEALGAFGGKGRSASTFSYALVPRHRRRRGHPVVLSPALASAVAADGEAEHLSDAIRRCARLVGYLDVQDAGVVRNRNTPRG